MPRRPTVRLRAHVLLVCLSSAALVCAALLADAGSGGPASAAAAPALAAPRSYVAVADTVAHGRHYLRFELPAAPGRRGRVARLRLFALGDSGAGFAVRLVRGGATPRLGRVIARHGRVRAGRTLSVDVTRALGSRRVVELAVVRRRSGDGAPRFAGRAGDPQRAPRLVVGVAPAPAPVIAAAGDMVCDPNSPNRRNRTPGTCMDRETSDLLVGRDLAAVLTLGDNQYEKGALSAYSTTYDRTWGRVKEITRPSVGNHEYLTPGASGYFDYFDGGGRSRGRAGRRGQGWYSYDVGSWHLIALNSVCDEVGGCGPGSPQLRWLQADLAAHPAQCTLAYWHHPRWSSGGEHSNVRSASFWGALYDAGADVILAGHAHDYERFAPQTPDARPDDARGLREFVVGTGGKNNYPFKETEANSVVRDAQTSGVLLMTLREGGYDWRFAPVAGGRLRDSGSADCH